MMIERWLAVVYLGRHVILSANDGVYCFMDFYKCNNTDDHNHMHEREHTHICMRAHTQTLEHTHSSIDLESSYTKVFVHAPTYFKHVLVSK